MGKAAREQLRRALNEHLNNIHETFQLLDLTPASSLEKTSWKEVIQMGEQISKQATTVGMLYTGDNPGVKALEENMSSYFNLLQGFLLLSHGSSTGAGPTLSSYIDASVKQVVDCSFKLLQEAVSSYGSPNKAQGLAIPQLVGTVWNACSSLKKSPATNVTAIGRAMTKVAVSMKDVLREIKEFKPAPDEVSEQSEDKSNEVSEQSEDKSNDCDDDDSFDGDLSNDLSPQEMKIVNLTITIVSETLVVIKELVRSITGLLQKESSDSCSISVDSLEELLKLSQGIGVQVDELGACLYPPQELSAIKVALEKITSFINEMEIELRKLDGFSDDYSKACIGLMNSLGLLEAELGCVCAGDLVPKLDNLVVRN